MAVAAAGSAMIDAMSTHIGAAPGEIAERVLGEEEGAFALA